MSNEQQQSSLNKLWKNGAPKQLSFMSGGHKVHSFFAENRECYGINKIDPDIEKTLRNLKGNKFLERVKKHALINDDFTALGETNRIVAEAAIPNLIGRQLVWLVETTKPEEQFPRAITGKAYRVGQGGPTIMTGEDVDSVTIKANIEYQAGMEWTDTYLEDVAWDVLQRETAEIGRSIAEAETEEVYTALDDIAEGDLAGGAAVALGENFGWAQLVDLVNEVKKENFKAKVIAAHPTQIAKLLKDATFIDSLKIGLTDEEKRTGIIGETRLGVKILETTKATAGTVYCIDTDWALGMPLRRDITSTAYDVPRDRLHGVVGSSRFGVGVVRSKAVAKGTGG